MAKVEVNGRLYATRDDISPEQAARARVLVDTMERIVNEDFSKPVEESRVGEFKAMRRELEEMGFLVEINYDVNLETGGIIGYVVISVVRSTYNDSLN